MEEEVEELIKQVAAEMADKLYVEIMKNLKAKLKDNNINIECPNDDTQHDYIPFGNLDGERQEEIRSIFNNVNAAAISDHTYERAAERGISAAVLDKIEYCTEKNIIGIQSNGRYRIGVQDGREVVVCVVCVENNTIVVITCWRAQLTNPKRYAIETDMEFF